MKKTDDFKIIDGIAVLEGISYKEEAMIVDEFLKNNPDIINVSLKTKDNRYFELNNGKLILSNKTKFCNPYYNVKSNDKSIEIDTDISLNKADVFIRKVNEVKTEITNYNTNISALLNNILEMLKD